MASTILRGYIYIYNIFPGKIKPIPWAKCNPKVNVMIDDVATEITIISGGIQWLTEWVNQWMNAMYVWMNEISKYE